MDARPLFGVRVLLVDDDADSAETTTFVLVHHGAEVVAVTTAPAALLHSITFKPDVLITDLAMPAMDGFELLRKFRAAGDTFPAIAISAHAEESYLDRGKAAGFAAYLVKPVQPATLVETILTVLGNPPSGK